MKTRKTLAMTMVHGHDFVDKWISHYGSQVGRENLLIISHGDSPGHTLPQDIGRIVLPRNLASSFEQDRITLINQLANGLLSAYERVIFVDIDELIFVHPKLGKTLGDYLLECESEIIAPFGFHFLSEIGEEPIDWKIPLIDQAKLVVPDERFCKPSIRATQCQQGIGGHALFDRDFHLDFNLFMFHLKYLDPGILGRYQAIKGDIKKVKGEPKFFGQWNFAEKTFHEYRAWARSLEQKILHLDTDLEHHMEVRVVPQPPERHRVFSRKPKQAYVLSDGFNGIL